MSASADPERSRREAAAQKTARDLARLKARPKGDGLLPALRLLGSIGWPIALSALVGVGAGRWLGGRGGPALTALCIALGAGAGAWAAYAGARGTQP